MPETAVAEESDTNGFGLEVDNVYACRQTVDSDEAVIVSCAP